MGSIYLYLYLLTYRVIGKTPTGVVVVDSVPLHHVGVGLVKRDELVLKSLVLQLHCQQSLVDALEVICSTPHARNRFVGRC